MAGSVPGTACLRRSGACRSGAVPPGGKVVSLVDPLVAPSRWAGIAADRRPYAPATRSAGLHRPVPGGIVIADDASRVSGCSCSDGERQRFTNAALAAPAPRTAHRNGQADDDEGGQHPPGRQACMNEQRGERQPRHDCQGKTPVVPDDEVVPEGTEPSQPAHLPPPEAVGCRTRLVRNHRTRATATAEYARISSRTAASLAGHSTPAPSAAQKVPELVQSTPTANLRVFSGTRVRGWGTGATTARANNTAAAAA